MVPAVTDISYRHLPQRQRSRRTGQASRPAHRGHTHPAGQRRDTRYLAQASSQWEALLQLQQSPGIILAHDHEHYMLGLVASSKYPYTVLIISLSTTRRTKGRYM